MTIVAKSLTGQKALELPPWLQEKKSDEDAMLATLKRLARKPEGGA